MDKQLNTIVARALNIPNAIAIAKRQYTAVEELTRRGPNGQVRFTEWAEVPCPKCGEIFILLGDSIFSDKALENEQYAKDIQEALLVDHQESRGNFPPHWSIYDLHCLFSDKFHTFNVMEQKSVHEIIKESGRWPTSGQT
jgi:hypothetical protein